jgi:hypothetical protein
VRRLELRAQDGRVLQPEDTVVIGFPDESRTASRSVRKRQVL